MARALRRRKALFCRAFLPRLGPPARASGPFFGDHRIHNATGLRITVHQFRHAAGAIILQRHPGNYELVRRVLGHRNVQTTVNAYIGLESIQASEIFHEIVIDHLNEGLKAAE